MREALIASENDFPANPERGKGKRKRASAKPTAPGRMSWLRSALRPRVALFAGFVAVAAIGVPLNALYLQDGRHPAPLFTSALTLTETARPPAAAPPPSARPASASARAPAVKTEPAREAARTEAPRAAAKDARDEIGMLIDGGGAKVEHSDKTVLFAQRALAKLGYPIRADGVLGGSTHQAIEKFERDSGLPVKGEITPKILRQLTSRSGLTRD